MTSPGRAKAITALMLLLPSTPMLFQGQEFWASTPFHYFADHEEILAGMVRKGRLAELGRWPGLMQAIEDGSVEAGRRLRGATALLQKPLALSGIPYGFVRREPVAERPDVVIRRLDRPVLGEGPADVGVEHR